MFALSICNYEMRPLGGYLGVKDSKVHCNGGKCAEIFLKYFEMQNICSI